MKFCIIKVPKNSHIFYMFGYPKRYLEYKLILKLPVFKNTLLI